MKIYVDKASDKWEKGKVKDYPNLQWCIADLFETEDFGDLEPAVIVSKGDDITKDKCGEECEYKVTIYDDFVE